MLVIKSTIISIHDFAKYHVILSKKIIDLFLGPSEIKFAFVGLTFPYGVSIGFFVGLNKLA